MTDLKLPELPEDLQAWERDFNCQYSTRYERPDVARILADWRASLTAYATAAVLAEREARGKALADGYAGSMFGTSPSSGDQQRVVLYYKTAEQALAAHDWLCDTLDAAMGGDDAR